MCAMRFMWRMMAAVVLPVLAGGPVVADDIASPHALTFYAGRISAEETWHDVLLKPWSSHYADSYIVTGAYSRAYR